jgi:nucleotide-binding universal stress UspA family protein
MIGVKRKPEDRRRGDVPELTMGYSRIIVPVHGTSADRRAIEVAGLLGSGKSAEMVLVHVVEVAQSLPLEMELPVEVSVGEQTLREAEEWARKAASARVGRISPELLQARSAGAAIVDEAIERGAEVIVMALCQHLRHGQPTPGETVPYVLKNAPCEVIVTRLPSDCD